MTLLESLFSFIVSFLAFLISTFLFSFRPEITDDLDSLFSSKSEAGGPLIMPPSRTVDRIVSVLYAGKTVKGFGEF